MSQAAEASISLFSSKLLRSSGAVETADGPILPQLIQTECPGMLCHKSNWLWTWSTSLLRLGQNNGLGHTICWIPGVQLIGVRGGSRVNELCLVSVFSKELTECRERVLVSDFCNCCVVR